MAKLTLVLAALAAITTVSAHFSPIDIVLRSKLPSKLPKNIPPSPAISAHFLSQRVNHFDPQDTQRFDQRYFLNDEFFTPNGPIIIYLHAYPEDTFSINYLTFGPVHDLARNVSGLIVHAHQRYFLESIVFAELTRENLRYCTVNQSLEDLAHLISHLRNADERRDSRIILVGWDYGASLAAWFAQRHPHLVSGIWASAARLQPNLGHDEPVHHVESAMRRGGEECFARIENSFRQFEELLENNRSNTIRRRFNFCSLIPNTQGDFDVMYFYDMMMRLPYGYTEFYDGAVLAEIFCPGLLEAPVEEDWEVIGYIYGLIDIPPPLCYPNSVEWQVESAKDTYRHGTIAGISHAYLYLQCAEFGFFFTSGNGTSAFGANFPREFFAHICGETFGFTESQMIENYQLFNTIHGGRRPVIPNAYFINGEFYQWIDQTIAPDAVHPTSFYEIVPGRSLHTELSLILNDPAFDELRGRIFAAIRQWLEL